MPPFDEERYEDDYQASWEERYNLLRRAGASGVTPGNVGNRPVDLSPPGRIGSFAGPGQTYGTTDYSAAAGYAINRAALASGYTLPTDYLKQIRTHGIGSVPYRPTMSFADQPSFEQAPGRPPGTVLVSGEMQRFTGGVPAPEASLERAYKGWYEPTGAAIEPPARILQAEDALRAQIMGSGPEMRSGIYDRGVGREQYIGGRNLQEANRRFISSLQSGAGPALEDPQLGSRRFVEIQTGAGERIHQALGYVEAATGQATIPTATMQSLQNTLAGAGAQALQRYSDMNPRDMVANVRRTLSEVAKEEVKKIEDSARSAKPGDMQADLEGRQLGQNVNRAAVRMINHAVGNLEQEYGVKGVASMARSAIKLSGQDLQAALGGQMGQGVQAAAIQAVSAMGGPQQAMQHGVSFVAPGIGGGTGGEGGPGAPGAGMMYTMGPGGTGWQPGGPIGGGGGAGGGRRGIWGGDLGGMMYGAYIARRFWSYTGAPAIRAMGEYAGAQAELEPLLTGQIPTGGPGAFTAQQGIGQYMLGEGAYNLAGGVMGISNQALQIPGMGTAAAGAGIFGGLGLGMHIMGAQMAGSQTAEIASLGSRLSRWARPVALAGAAYTIAQAGTSAYEQMTGRDVSFLGMTSGGFQNSMLAAAGQTVGRGFASMGMLGNAGLSALGGVITGDMAGAQEAYQARVGRFLDSTTGQFLTSDVGREMPGGRMASATDITRLAGRLNVDPTQIAGLLGPAIRATGQQGLGPLNERLVTAMNEMMQTQGISGASVSSQLGGYAEALGYLPGQAGYGGAMLQFAGMGVEEQARAWQQAQTAVGRASQFRQFISEDQMGEVALREFAGGFGTGQQAQAVIGGVGALTQAGMRPADAMLYARSMQYNLDTGRVSPFQAQAAMGISAEFQEAGMGSRIPQVMQQVMGMNADQIGIAGRMWSGDLGAMSYAANIGMVDSGFALTDIGGRPMEETNLGQAMQNLAQVAGLYGEQGMGGGALMQSPAMGNLGGFMRAFQAAGGGGAGMQAGLSGIGISDRMSSFFGANPQAGLQDYAQAHSDRMYGFQQAGIGIGLQRIALQREFMYGGGDWRNPTAGSIWGIEDRMRALQWQGQQESAAFSLQRMDVGNQFAQRQEALTGERMGATQDYQRWGFGFQRAGMDLQRQWTMQDRQYQDQMRGLNMSWQLEDFDEQIRMSSGRQRRQLVQQRERYTTTQNLEGEQIDRQRERQEEMWAREDEQYEKRLEYAETLMELDNQQFEMNRERRETLYEMDRNDLERRIELSEKLHELQEEMITKQREYQVAQLDLSEKALGIQAAAAAAQKEYNDDMRKLMDETMKPIQEIISNMAKNEKGINKWIDLTNSVNNVDASKLSGFLWKLNMIIGYD